MRPARNQSSTSPGLHVAPQAGSLALARRRACLSLLAGTTLLPGVAGAQERFSLFVGSPQFTVDRMVKMAQLRDDDVVVDLGSGDGRIVLSALKANPKVRGWGVDINPALVAEATENARAQGLADRARFYHRNVFDADISEATVITMWLFPELMRLLRPKLLAEARPGTRLVSNGFEMPGWTPDFTDTEGGRVLVWVVPAKVEGYWNWDLPVTGSPQGYEALLEQLFQLAEGICRVGDRRGVFTDMKLRGEDLSFAMEITLDKVGLTRQEFSGKVRGDRIEGSVKVVHRDDPDYKTVTYPWRAERARTTAYFRPTGLAK
ncbi:MAG: class I SAM-dependent methyltransferase [Betaproteobacteria bacterium]|jgi:hypothetical protein|nr:class I SAM-dependent methyltransferase [Betaproteobacteria bacterium]